MTTQTTVTTQAADGEAKAGVQGVDQTQDGGTGDAAGIPQETREYALKQGWVPKERFRGDPTKWVDADVYAERAEQINPIIKERNKRLEAELTEARTVIARHDEEIKQAVSFVKSASKREYDEKLNELKKARAEAVTAGDGEAFATIDAKIDNLKPPTDPVKPADVQVPLATPEVRSAGIAFTERNPWFGDGPSGDQRRTRLALAVATDMRAETPGIEKNPSYFEALERRLAQDYPEIFKKKLPALTDGGGAGGGGAAKGGAGRTYADLPPDAKKAADKFATRGDLTKEQYAKEWFAIQGEQ